MAWLASAKVLGCARSSGGTPSARAPARSHGAAGSTFCALLGLAACTDFEPATDVGVVPDPDGDAETALLEALPEQWRCLNEAPVAATPLAGAASAPRVVRSLQLVGFVGSTDMSATRVRGCTVRDPACTSPVTPQIAPTADGWVDVPLYEGFDGYLEITSPGAVPSMLFYGEPLTSGRNVDPEPAFLVAMETALTFDRLFLGREGFPNTGVINIRALDCQNAPAPGVEFRLEPAAVSWYYVGEIPVGAARATTESGVGGFSDVSPGTVVVTAELVENGRQLAPPQGAFVRGGWFTNIRFRH